MSSICFVVLSFKANTMSEGCKGSEIKHADPSRKTDSWKISSVTATRCRSHSHMKVLGHKGISFSIHPLRSCSGCCKCCATFELLEYRLEQWGINLGQFARKTPPQTGSVWAWRGVWVLLTAQRRTPQSRGRRSCRAEPRWVSVYRYLDPWVHKSSLIKCQPVSPLSS